MFINWIKIFLVAVSAMLMLAMFLLMVPSIMVNINERMHGTVYCVAVALLIFSTGYLSFMLIKNTSNSGIGGQR